MAKFRQIWSHCPPPTFLPLQTQIREVEKINLSVWLRNEFFSNSLFLRNGEKMVRISVTRLLDYLFNICSFTTLKICQQNFKALPDIKWTLSKWPKFFNIVPKWRNFTKSGHIGSNKRIVSHSVLELFIRQLLKCTFSNISWSLARFGEISPLWQKVFSYIFMVA